MRAFGNIIRDMISHDYSDAYCAQCGGTDLRLENVETKRKLSTGRTIIIPGTRMVCQTCGHKGKIM